ncbi:zinc finger protein 839 isoform X1 [Silurus asotus]|uniref:Zinc finger protein 839 isoform X1 n=1 Tax=Silurus asotus TaxID=30991 RepID=A0AAD5AJ96_SILAS|nr:zinc finger protein 839 isoform X1 [Silurus asotus]
MADNEDESSTTNSTALTAASPVNVSESQANVPASTSSQIEVGQGDGSIKVFVSGEGGGEHGLSHLVAAMPSESSADTGASDGSSEVIGQILGAEVLTSYVQTSDTAEENMTTECTTISSDFLNALGPATTIIYVQPDGSFVESSGLTVEEQQQLLEQLSKQQLVQVTGSEATRVIEQSQALIPTPVQAPAPVQAPKPLQSAKPAVISSVDVQQVIDHVNKSQVRAQTPKILQRSIQAQTPSYITLEGGNVISGQVTTTMQPQPFTIVQNASQQLQSVAKQVALHQSQNGAQPIQHKLAEPIRIQVQAPPKQEIKQRQTTPITILQSQSLPVSQSVVKVSTVGTVSTPQIIHITPVPGQQQYFLQNPGEPPIQLLLQKPASVVSSISVPIVHKVQAPVSSSSLTTTVKSPAPKPTTVSIQPTLILTPSTSVSSTTSKVLTSPTKATTVATKISAPAVEKEKPKAKNRKKKPLKIQTRSGRVSRPPKHKVKDYKFIKTEDLAESHQSDSDDYSEISMEDEEGSEGKKKTDVDGLSLRSKAFKCETCEKSYIGVAGLNRHYKLNPTHDKSQTSTPDVREDSNPTEETTPSEAAKPSPVKEATTQKVQADSTRQILPRRPGRPKGSGKSSLPKRLGRKPKRGRPGRPPKHQTALTVEQQTERRRSRLAEFIQQYDDKDLLEIVLPRLAKVMTVWEFVLMKVENGHLFKQQFPSVYHEFEQLHSQVKKMAQEHFSISPASRAAIEVTNMEVLKSLGITDPSSAFTPLNSSNGQQGAVRNPATKNPRNIENTRMLPPAKRFKMENCSGENISATVNQNGIQKHECNEDSILLREPQVVLTRLESLSDVDADPETRTEEAATDTAEYIVDPEAGKLQEDPDGELSEVLNNSGSVDIADQVKQLEQVLSSETCEEISDKDENCDPPPMESLDEGEALGEPVVSELVMETVEAQEETVFIQTAEGLVRQSAEELASKGIVIVNGPDGSTVHIEAPEGVPLETVHALLGIEPEKKT